MAFDAISQPALRVTVVGPCASGKTTLVEGLRARGFDAWVTGQEHSAIADLWNHLDPDALIALTVDLETIRERRGEQWLSSVYDAQIERLKNAYDNADLVIDAAGNESEGVLRFAVDFLDGYEPER